MKIARAEKYFPGIVVAALVCVLVLLGAYWAKVFVAPRETRNPPPELRGDAPAMADRIIAARLFGSSMGDVPPEPVRTSTLKVRLKGVVAGRDNSPGYAIVNTGSGKDESVKVGAEVLPGARLASVHPTHILLDRGGARERVDLEDNASAGRAPATQGSPPQRAAPSGAPAPGLGARRSGAAEPPGAGGRRSASNPGGTGFTLADVPAGSVAGKVGLQQGDVVLSVNGQPVTQLSDLEALGPQLAVGNPIQIDAMRGSTPLQLRPQFSD